MSIPQSIAYTVLIKAFLSSDHVSPATGKTLAVVISKAGAAFGNPSAGASNAAEVANGWYSYALSTTDTGTVGDLVVRLTGTGTDDAERILQVVNANTGGLAALPAAGVLAVKPAVTLAAADVSGNVPADLQTIKTQTVTCAGGVTIPAATLASTANITAGTITTTTNLTNLPTIPANWLTAAGIAAAALNGKGDWLASGSYPTNFAALLISVGGHITSVDTLTTYTGNTPQTGDNYARIGVAGAGLTALGDVRIAHLDADVSSRSTYAGADTAGTTTLLARLTAPRATNLDNLDATVSSRLASTSYTAPPTAAQVATAVWTDTTAGDFTTTSSPGKILVGQMGGTFTSASSSVFTSAALINAPGGSAADPLLSIVPGVYASGTAGAALGKIGSGQIVTQSVVLPNGNFTVTRGMDYFAADNRSIDWTDQGGTWPNLSGAVMTFATQGGTPAFTKTVSGVSLGVAHQTIRLELSAADTRGFTTPSGIPFMVSAVLADGHQIELLTGTMTTQTF